MERRFVFLIRRLNGDVEAFSVFSLAVLRVREIWAKDSHSREERMVLVEEVVVDLPLDGAG